MQNKNNIVIIILLVIIAVALIVIALKKPKTQPIEVSSENTPMVQQLPTVIPLQNNPNSSVSNEYQNIQSGFSFVIPSQFGSVKTYNNGPLVMPGETGQSMRGYLSNNNPILYFAGMTTNYTASRGIDCGEMRSVDAYEEASSIHNISLNSKGEQYIYANVTTNEMEGPHQVAYFKTSRGPFPVLGFCAIGMNESDFKKVIDTVSLQ